MTKTQTASIAHLEKTAAKAHTAVKSAVNICDGVNKIIPVLQIVASLWFVGPKLKATLNTFIALAQLECPA